MSAGPRAAALRRAWTPAMRARALGIALVALSIVVVVGPFLWVLANSFKSPIAILQGAWTFVPTLDNYADVLSSKRSDFVHALATSLAVATASTVIVVAIATTPEVASCAMARSIR